MYQLKHSNDQSSSLVLWHFAKPKACYLHRYLYNCGTWCPLFSIRKKGNKFRVIIYCGCEKREFPISAQHVPPNMNIDYIDDNKGD